MDYHENACASAPSTSPFHRAFDKVYEQRESVQKALESLEMKLSPVLENGPPAVLGQCGTLKQLDAFGSSELHSKLSSISDFLEEVSRKLNKLRNDVEL